MFISRRLAHKVHNELTAILGAIELDRKEDAKERIKKLSALVAGYTESAEMEKARKDREDEQSK